MPPRPRSVSKPAIKAGLHPRNRHRRGYDFPHLLSVAPGLAPFVIRNPAGQPTIDFAHPPAVLALNAALLRADYGIVGWTLPPRFLCPPVPGRADYLHVVADLLARDHGGTIPRGGDVRVLDVGVGANLIYPLIGHREYGWSFIGSDTVPAALNNAQRILDANPGLAKAIDLRHQPDPGAIFDGILADNERVEVVICNPPFHASRAQAAAGTRRKLRNLGRDTGPLVLNFGGLEPELCCPGGEVAFITRMIVESARRPLAARWFTTLVAQDAHVGLLRTALNAHHARRVEVLPMAQGNKRSRLLAWTMTAR